MSGFHTRRSPMQVVAEWRLPPAERRAARSERAAEEQLRAERDSTREGERRLAAVEAESRRYSNLFGPPR